jgi:hypothetical protein
MDDGCDQKQQAKAAVPDKVDLKPSLSCADLENDQQQVDNSQDDNQRYSSYLHLIIPPLFAYLIKTNGHPVS